MLGVPALCPLFVEMIQFDAMEHLAKAFLLTQVVLVFEFSEDN